MSNSIWHKAGFREAIDTKLKTSKYGKWIYWTMYGWNIAGEDVHDIGVEWAYLEDIIAQADKVERLQKAVDLALFRLENILMDDEEIKIRKRCPLATSYLEYDIEIIKQLIKGE